MTISKQDIHSPDWLAFVEAHSNADIFHHPVWAGFIADCYGYEPFVLAKLNESGQIDAGIPFIVIKSWLTGCRWVSLPFSDYCEPIFKNYSSFSALVEYLISQQEKHSVPNVEIRTSIPPNNTVYYNDSFVRHTLKLTGDADVLLHTFHRRRVRQEIRQSIERGVEVRWGTSKEDMRIFYEMMTDTHRRLGVPVQPKYFFDLLWDRLIEKNYGFLLLAYKGREPIAGAVFLSYKNMVTIKYNASYSQYWNLKANNLLYWSAIKWGCENSFSYFDFGRTDLLNKGLRDFKNGWGAEESPLCYSFLSSHPYKPISNRLMSILNFVTKKSPLWVCRLSGEFLYKHFG
jgi:lipid II:glycine glycyltransferase (peptidoglycan interpeptide bridge formation enzyme)